MSKRKFSSDDDDEESEIQVKRSILHYDRVVIHQSTISLQNLTSIRAAVSLWQHHNIRHLSKKIGYEENNSDVTESDSSEDGEYYTKTNYRASHYDLRSLSYKVEKKVKELPIPQAIQRMIRDHISPVVEEMRKWMDYHHGRIFFQHKDSRIMYHYLDEIIWKSNGQVDFVATARNMLTSLKVNDIEKYRLISTYCLEDEIGNVSKQIFCNKYRTKVRFDAHPLLFYWRYYASGTLDNLKGTYTSAENRMITMQGVDNIHALQYFWNRLNENDQVQMAAFLIRRDGLKYQGFLLSLMNEVQQHNLFVEMGVEIILNFAKESSHWQYVFSSWMFIRNFISENQFVEIIFRIIELQESVRFHQNTYSYNMITLRNIWKSAPHQFRKFAIQYEDHKIIKSLAKSTYRLTSSTAQLLFEILHDASAEVRLQTLMTPPSQYSNNFYYHLISCGKPSLLEDFMKLCCQDDDAIVELKSRIINSSEARTHCLFLCIENKLETLDEFLAIYLPPEQIYDFRVQLLTSNEGIQKCTFNFLRSLRLEPLNEIINHILPTQQEADEFRKKLVFSDACLRESPSLISSGLLFEVRYFVESLLSSAEDVKNVKKRLELYYMSKPISNIFTQFKPEIWQEFLLWCLDGEENVNKFKLSLPFENIFNEMLQQSTFKKYDDLLKNCKFNYRCYFSDLDRFLLWYFVTSEEVKKFKIGRIFEYYKIGMINTLLKKKNDDYLHIVVKWFFGKDEEQIKKFKDQFPSCKISLLI